MLPVQKLGYLTSRYATLYISMPCQAITWMVNVLPLSSIWGIGWGMDQITSIFLFSLFSRSPRLIQKEKQVQVIFVCSFISSWIPISVLRILYVFRCLGCLWKVSLLHQPYKDPANGLTSNLRNIIAIIYALFIHALAYGLKTLKSLLLLLIWILRAHCDQHSTTPSSFVHQTPHECSLRRQKCWPIAWSSNRPYRDPRCIVAAS